MNIRYACFCIALLFVAAGHASGQAPESASEKVAKRLEELLQPAGTVSSLPGSAPVIWPGTRAIEQPQLPAVAYRGLPPRPPLASGGKQAAPRSTPESAPPIAQGGLPPRVPKPTELPTQPLVHWPAVDVDSPLPLPILATPKHDRASLDDTTLEASQAAALQPVTPRRTRPVPFVPLNLPDPFEHIRTGRLQNPPEESEQPPAVPIRTPKR